jgi:hypothetical protein
MAGFLLLKQATTFANCTLGARALLTQGKKVHVRCSLKYKVASTQSGETR